MNQIVEKKQLSENVFQIKVKTPLIPSERLPGQFIILQIDNNYGERIPLTIADTDKKAGTITLIFQTVGKTTHLLSNLNEGDSIENLVGPLGRPTHIENYGSVVCIGGGIGTAPLYPIIKALKEAGNYVTTILGARTKKLIILEDKVREVSDEIVICTDDGSYGIKGLVTLPLEEICKKENKPDMVFAIGPAIMMKFCAETTKVHKIPIIVSLNTIMVDGTGMCGGCRVTVGKETKFVCVDGPEFDGHLVDFDNMINRLGSYKKIEEKAHHKCKLENK